MTVGRTVANDVLLGQVCGLVATGKRVRLRAKGDSMRPFIRGNEDIIVFSSPERLSVSNVVMACIGDGQYVVHRIVHIDGDNVQLAGDANLYQVEKCLRKDICALAVSVVRQGREHSLIDFKTRVSARLWRLLLPFRRILWRMRRIFMN